MNDVTNVFISHKMEDGDAAIDIKRELKTLCSDRLNVFVSKEIPEGDSWLREIMTAIADARIFILLLTGKRPTWDWSMFELGLFIDPSTWGDATHVICMHHHQTPIPAAVSGFQSLPIDSKNLDNVVSFLERFYGDAEYVGADTPIQGELSREPKLLLERATAIARFFDSANERPHFPHMRMVLNLEGEELIENFETSGVLPSQTHITDDDGLTLPTLFGFSNDGSATWHDILEKSESRGFTRWGEELGAACAAGSKREIGSSINATLRTVRGGAIFRPVLFRVDTPDPQRRRFHVLFEPETSPSNFAGTDHLGKIYLMLRVAHRFRWEVIQTYKGNMTDMAEKLGADNACRRLKEVIELVEADAKTANLMQEDSLTGPLQTDEHKTRAAKMLADWDPLFRTKIFNAFETQDLPAIEDALAALEKLNAEFLAICSESYALIARGRVNGTVDG